MDNCFYIIWVLSGKTDKWTKISCLILKRFIMKNINFIPTIDWWCLIHVKETNNFCIVINMLISLDSFWNSAKTEVFICSSVHFNCSQWIWECHYFPTQICCVSKKNLFILYNIFLLSGLFWKLSSNLGALVHDACKVHCM